MYFDFRTFLRLAYLSLFRWKDTYSPLTAKRIIFLIGFFSIFPVVQLFNAACFLLDELLFSEHRRIEIEKPVFIVGNPRSGTTFIHRLMARDEEQFFCFRTWEIIFPAIVQKKVLSFVGQIDRLMGSIFSNRLKRFESRFFLEFDKMHQIRLFHPEEDDKLLLHIFSCIDLIWFFPFTEELKWLDRFDQLAGPENRKRIMTFYKKCIKRQAYFKGNKGHFLSKNPAASSKIDSLYEFFPDCKIIYMVRNPLEVIPSIISMAHEIWRFTINMNAGYPFQDNLYETVKLFYNYPLARLEQAPKNSYAVINYEDLVRQPGLLIQRVYQKFGFELSPNFLKILKEEQTKAKDHKSRHSYSLEQFRFTREQIVSDLRNVYDQFGFDTSR